MMMMEEARRSGYEALKSAFLHAENRLTEFAETPDSSTSESPTTGLTMIFNRLNWLELKKKMARNLVERILKPWGPECRLFIMYLLQRGSLMSRNATVSESLYGGKRVKLGLQENNQRRLVPMPKRDGVRLAFLISFGPYLTERADMLYNKLGQMGDDESASLSQKIRKIFKVVYPLLHMSAQGMHLLEQWKYLLGHSLFFDPYSKWLDLVVRRVTEQDQPEKKNTNSSESNKPAVLENTLDKSRSLIANSNVKAAALGILSSALFIGWIARVRATRQDLQRRISNSSRLGGGGRQQHNVLPPPPPPPPAKNIDLASLPAHICPLCRQPKINPTASTGGYVFCFKCITAHVRETETCPITGRACPESRLVRLYEPNSG
eukprot:scaffold473_cov132-Cylindrotheca_fusiformis.AAC.5